MQTRTPQVANRLSATLPRVALCTAALCAAVSFPATAHAEPPRTAGALQLGGGFRYGVDLKDSEPDPWGVGLGLELGYTLESAVYVGGVFDYFFGQQVSYELPGRSREVSANLWQVAAEGGYDIQLSDGVLVRPKLGLGVAMLQASCSGDCIEDTVGSSSYFAAAPGLTTMFFPGNMVLSLDARYQMVFADELASALIFSVGIGF